MSLTLREKLKLSAVASNEEVEKVCDKYELMYKHAILTASDDQIKRIAIARERDLTEALDAENLKASYDKNFNTYGEIYNESIELMLNDVDGSGKLSPSAVTKIEESINALPESAIKYYYKCALVKNSSDVSFESCQEMLSLIDSARRQDPNNFVYKQIVTEIENEVNTYSNDLEEWRRIEAERIQKEKNIATAKKIFLGIGKGILYVLGAIGAVMAGIIGLVCTCGEACDC